MPAVRVTQRPRHTDLALRAETGAPQWVIIDEAHELARPTGPLRALFDPTAGAHCLVTYHPEQLSAEVLNSADVIISASPPIDQVLGTVNVPAAGLPKAVTGQAMLMRTDRAGAGQPFMVATRITKHQRHQRKYAELCLPTGRGFRFRPFQGHQLPRLAPSTSSAPSSTRSTRTLSAGTCSAATCPGGCARSSRIDSWEITSPGSNVI